METLAEYAVRAFGGQIIERDRYDLEGDTGFPCAMVSHVVNGELRYVLLTDMRSHGMGIGGYSCRGPDREAKTGK